MGIKHHGLAGGLEYWCANDASMNNIAVRYERLARPGGPIVPGPKPPRQDRTVAGLDRPAHDETRVRRRSTY